MTEVRIKITGLDKLIKAFDRFPREIARTFSQAGHEAAEQVILPTQGLRNYPPPTDANAPPTPYYKRGTGTVTSVTTHHTSEVLKKRWHVRRTGSGSVQIGNVASYAQFVHGDEQAKAMAKIGWRKLLDVAKEKRKGITAVYQAHVTGLIKRLGL